MRNFTHYVVTTNNAGLHYVAPLSGARDLPQFPQRMVRWGCVGPYLIAWGHTIVTHKPLPDALFNDAAINIKSSTPIGNWFRQRRKALPRLLDL